MKVFIAFITIFFKIKSLVAFNYLYQIIGSKKCSACNCLQMSAVKDMDGILPPTGFFDPLQLSLGKSEAELKKWREAELKHGRLSMLATVGIIVAEKFHPFFNGLITGPGIYHFQQADLLLPNFWLFVLFNIGLVEAYNINKGRKQCFSMGKNT